MTREELLKELKQLIIDDEHNWLNKVCPDGSATNMALQSAVGNMMAREDRLKEYSDEELEKYYERLKIKVENKIVEEWE